MLIENMMMTTSSICTNVHSLVKMFNDIDMNLHVTPNKLVQQYQIPIC